VITKLDLMDEGTDAKDILENKHLPLRRGEPTHSDTLHYKGLAMTHCFPLVVVRRSYSKMLNAPNTEKNNPEKGRSEERRSV